MREWINIRNTFLELKWILKKRISLIIISLLLGLAVSVGVTYFLLPLKYSSSVQMIASTPKSENGNQDINSLNFNLQMINTYRDILLKSSTVAEETSKDLKVKGDYSRSIAEIKSMIQVEQDEGSQVFSIILTSNDPYEAKEIANLVALNFEKQVESVVSIDKVSILEAATLDTMVVSPNHKINIILGGLLGLFFGISFAIFRELFNRTVTSQKMAEAIFDVPMLGSVNVLSTEQLNLEVDFESLVKKNNSESVEKPTTSRIKKRRRKKI